MANADKRLSGVLKLWFAWLGMALVCGLAVLVAPSCNILGACGWLSDLGLLLLGTLLLAVLGLFNLIVTVVHCHRVLKRKRIQRTA